MLGLVRSQLSSAFVGLLMLSLTACTARLITPPPSTAVTLTGVIQLAPVKNEKVMAFKLAADGSLGSSPVAEGTSSEDGTFSLVVPAAGLYVIKTEGVGKHLDEASKVEQDAVALSAVADTNQQTEVPITPVSTLHQERAIELIKSGGKTPEEAIEMAAGEVAPKFNLDETDLSEAPVSPYGVAALSIPERVSKARRIKVAERLATFSYFIQSFSLQGLGNDEKLDKLMAALRADFKDDGLLNGSITGDLRLIALKAALTWASGMTTAKESVLLDEAMAFDDVQSDIALVASSVAPGEEAFNPGVTLTGLFLDKYYVNSQLAQLSDGAQEGLYYKDGELAHGFMESECYVNGLSMLNNGSGYCELDNKYYASGQLAQGVMSNGRHYTSGRFSQFSDGAIDGTIYVDGLPGNGILENGLYYQNGVLLASGFSFLHVRATGRDDGNGSLGAPYATPQKAFEVAYAGTGNFVIMLGIGNFDGVNLNVANASEWPQRIRVFGEGANRSFLGGIGGTWDGWNFTSGGDIKLICNGQVDLGNIISAGLDREFIIDGPSSGDAPGGGTIELANCKAGTVTSQGGHAGNDGYAGWGGNIALIDSTTGDVASRGGNNMGGFNTTCGGGGGGRISLVNSTSGALTSRGGTGVEHACFARGGGSEISLTNSSAGTIISNGANNGYFGPTSRSDFFSDSKSSWGNINLACDWNIGCQPGSDGISYACGSGYFLLGAECVPYETISEISTASTGNIVYRLYDLETNWWNAKDFCETRGGKLPEPYNSEQEEVLQYLFQNNYGAVWLGYRYVGTSLVSNQGYSYTNHPQLLNGIVGNCGVLKNQSIGRQAYSCLSQDVAKTACEF